jgi:hypothetical protein
MSDINFLDIDGNYPVAGQDNNSQGFRDNFTNIRVALETANDEVGDLQIKALLRAPLVGSNIALSTSNNLANAASGLSEGALLGAVVRNFGATKITSSTTSGTVTVNYVSGHYVSVSTTGSITLAFTNFPASGTYGYLKVQINITNIAHTVTLPAAVTLGLSGLQGYAAGTITFAATGVYEFAFGTYDAGTTITIFDLNRALTNFAAADLTVDDLTAAGNANVSGSVNAGTTITSLGSVSAAGNVIGGNVLTGGIISSTANVVGGNITTAGLMSSAGNVDSAFVNSRLRPTTGTSTLAPLVFTGGTLNTTATAGSVEYDGTVLYNSPTTAQRGLLPAMMFRLQTTNRTLADSASTQNVFDTPASITLDSSMAYELEAVYYITRSAGANPHTLSTLFSLGGSLTSITYLAETTSTTGNALGPVSRLIATGATATVVTASSSVTTEQITVTLRGIVRTNAGGSFTPQIQYSSAPGGAPTILANSFLRLTPLGTSSVQSVGNWS